MCRRNQVLYIFVMTFGLQQLIFMLQAVPISTNYETPINVNKITHTRYMLVQYTSEVRLETIN